MRIKIKRLPEHMYSWHRWFAWYPVRAYVETEETCVWVWLETVDRLKEDGWPPLRKTFYRVPEALGIMSIIRQSRKN